MPNNYFQFRQFTVYQDKCAMKVCTDACLFGAVTALLFAEKGHALRMLDIGTGTGLLALMFAQKNNNAVIDAVEIDGTAAQQAAVNFAASPWIENITVHHSSIQGFTQSRQLPSQTYNLVISNPPFFEHDLKSSDVKRNLALHSAELSLEALLSCTASLLSDDGVFGVLLPWHRTDWFEKFAAGKGFHCIKKFSVKQTPQHSYFRSILFFSRVAGATFNEEIIIKDESNVYTAAFTALLKDYYLYL